MGEKILNLTQHSPTPEQIQAGVEEPPAEVKQRIRQLLTFTSLPTYSEVVERAEELAEIAVRMRASAVMIGGAPYLMAPLEKALIRRGIQPLYAFSRREVVSTTLPSGEVVKKTVFKHLGWVKVPMPATSPLTPPQGARAERGGEKEEG